MAVDVTEDLLFDFGLSCECWLVEEVMFGLVVREDCYVSGVHWNDLVIVVFSR